MITSTAVFGQEPPFRFGSCVITQVWCEGDDFLYVDFETPAGHKSLATVNLGDARDPEVMAIVREDLKKSIGEQLESYAAARDRREHKMAKRLQ
jgi:hypothetical protein